MHNFGLYFTTGLEHILTWEALDHILFVTALCLRYQFKDYKKILILVTAFTIGHCTTLVLSTFNIISVKSIADTSRYGVIDMNERSEFTRIVEKPAPEQAPSTLINVSKYVMSYDLLSAIARYCEISISGEYYITEPINQYVMSGGSVVVAPAHGQYLDGGSEKGWLRANNIVLGSS